MQHDPGFFAVILNFYGYYVPLILLCSWAPLALIDLARRDDVDEKKGTIWTAAIVGLPFAGAFAYHVMGGSRLPSWVRNVLVLGGLGFTVVLALIATLLRY